MKIVRKQSTSPVVSLALGWTLCVFLLPGCSGAAKTVDGTPVPAAASEVGMVNFIGSVKWIELEGGFWGLVSDKGARYLPDKLPEELRQDGLRVSAGIRIRKDVMTIQMWGTPVEIVKIQRAQP